MKRVHILAALAVAVLIVAAKPHRFDPFAVVNPFYSEPLRSGEGVEAVTEHIPGYYVVEFDRDVTDCAVMTRLADNTPGREIGAGRNGSVVEVYIFDEQTFDFIAAPFDVILRCGGTRKEDRRASCWVASSAGSWSYCSWWR